MQTLKQLAMAPWLVLALGASAPGQIRVPWMTDLPQAHQIAAQQQRLLLIHFWSDDCAPCQTLERHVFNRPEVVRAVTANYVPVSVDVRQTPEIARRYNVDRWPTDIMVTAFGSELLRTASPQDPNQYIAMLDQLAAHYRIGAESPGAEVAQRPFATPPAAPPVAYDQRRSTFQPPAQDGLAFPSRDGGYWAAGPTTAQTQTWNTYQTEDGRMQTAGNGGYARQPQGEYASRYASPAPRSQSAESPAYGAPYGGQPPREAAPPSWQYPPQQSQWPPADAQPGGGRPAAGPVESRWPRSEPRDFGASQPPPPSGQWDSRQGPTQAPPQGDPQWRQPPAPGPGAPGGPPPIGLDGFCPVTLVQERRWVKADPQWGAIHRDRTYLFAGPAEQQRFLADPDRYAPVLSGYDPVRYAEQAQLVEGKRQHGVFFRNQVYLFSDEAALQRFWESPQRYAASVQQAVQPTGLIRQ
jgi:YHS domain-containing protein